MFTHGGSLTERLNGFDKLSVHEKGLVVEAVKDFAVIVAAAVAAAVFRNLAEGADEEDEKKYYTMLYLSKRLQMDLMVFSVGSIGEFSRTLKDPTVALSTVNSTLNLLKFWNWGDEYKTGERAGKNKAWHNLNKTYNPIYKHIIMDFDPKAKVKYLDNVQS